MRRNELFLLPPDMRDWLPEDHLAWFIIGLVDELDLSAFESKYRLGAQGRPAHHPAMMLALLIYSYASDVHSSRRIERACSEDIACRVICGGEIPDHSTIARFRQIHDEAFRSVFLQVLRMCAEAGLVRLGVLAIDGTKVSANASMDANRSADGIRRLVDQVIADAEAADAAEDEVFGEARGDELPEWTRDPDRRKQVLAEAAERLRQKNKKSRVNTTDPDSRLMHGPAGGFVQAYNAQVAVDESGVVLAAEATSAENDLHQMAPVIDRTLENLAAAGIDAKPAVAVADNGYLSTAGLTGIDEDIEVVVAPGPRVPDAKQVAAADANHAAADAAVQAERQRRREVFARISSGEITPTEGSRELGIHLATLSYGYDRWLAGEPIPVKPVSRRFRKTSSHARLQIDMAAKLADPALAAAYARRAPLAEGAIASLKNRIGLRRISMRGRRAANAELTLGAAVHNVLKLRNAAQELLTPSPPPFATA